MQAELTVRRARRSDFARVRTLVGAPPEGSRAERKRFRRLVSTMREDLYLVERSAEEPLVGLAVIAYVRGLGPTTAIVRDLRGSDEATSLLLACAAARASARGCTRLEVQRAADDPWPSADGEWHDGPRSHQRPVPR